MRQKAPPACEGHDMRKDGQKAVLEAACRRGGLHALSFESQAESLSEAFADSFGGPGLREQVSFMLTKHRNTGKEKKVAIMVAGNDGKSWEKL